MIGWAVVWTSAVVWAYLIARDWNGGPPLYALKFAARWISVLTGFAVLGIPLLLIAKSLDVEKTLTTASSWLWLPWLLLICLLAGGGWLAFFAARKTNASVLSGLQRLRGGATALLAAVLGSVVATTVLFSVLTVVLGAVLMVVLLTVAISVIQTLFALAAFGGLVAAVKR